LTNLHITEFLW